MELTVAEALRLKNEIASFISQYNARTSFTSSDVVSYGRVLEDGAVVENEKDSKPFNEYYETYKHALAVSLILNDSISKFNEANRVSSLVRKRENAKVLVKTLKQALSRSKPWSKTKFEVVGDDRQAISVEFCPFMEEEEIRKELMEQKETVRTAQIEIDKLNAQIISVEVSEQDLDLLDL
jgi:hypothetical protein